MLPLITISVFIAVALMMGLLVYPVLMRKSLVHERLAKLVSEKTEKPFLLTQRSGFQEFLARIGEKIPIAPKEQSKYTKLLVAAGFRKDSCLIFLGSKIILACALAAAFVFFYALPKGVLMAPNTLLYLIALAIVGFLLPSFWLSRMVEKRKTEIFHTLPDVLDLLTVCVESGLGLDAALVRTCENPQFKGNPLAEELKTASMETRAGKPRSEALRDMAERTMVEDIKAFVAMLSQTERFGTSLSLALRVHSESLRTKRRQIAEEAAAKTAIKILFPLAFFIFPALMVVLVGPAFIKIAAIFK